MPKLGIFGLTNTGKSTLFNALTGLEAVAAAHPFATVEPNHGVATVPDEKLERAAEVEGSAKIVHASLDLLDLPALGQSGAGQGARFLGKLREMEALVGVLRAFHDPAVPDDESGTDPVTQAEELMLELAMADAEVFGRRAPKIAKEATGNVSLRPAAQAIADAAEVLAEGTPLRSCTWDAIQLAAFRDLAPLTLRPVVWVVNVDEDATGTDDLVRLVRKVVPDSDTVIALSARLEEEGARLDPADRAELFAELGLGEGALATMVRSAYQALGLISFYTVGPKESHAWTVRAGAKAPEAAGKIHSDLERGFIRAEIATMDQVIEAGGWDAAKPDKLIRVEGKDYVIQPEDVMVVRFSV